MRNVARPAPIAAVATLCAAAPALAQEPSDGADGRLTRDTALHLQLGAGPCSGPSTAAAARLSVLHLQTAGAYVSFSRSLTKHARPLADAMSLGTELRPLFLPRFLSDLERGPAWVDLALDSLTLSFGAAFDIHADVLGAPAFEAGLGVGLPLAARADGPWLGAHAMRRWPAARLGRQADAEPAMDLLVFALGWQLPVSTGLVSRKAQPAW
ncbi:MAG: hypothetical protein MUF54_25165 [Polyangiaceae bacterium]|jgi:hypothetical protein|nr:hypothetical protein [Polyangiaceae bacterium]